MQLMRLPLVVTPAKAGVSRGAAIRHEIPAFAGMTVLGRRFVGITAADEENVWTARVDDISARLFG